MSEKRMITPEDFLRVVETDRLILRRPNHEDSLVLKNLWKNKESRAYLGGIVADEFVDQKIADLQSHWDLHQFGQWAVIEKTLNQAVGLCGLHHSENGIEISYMFFPQFWGQGFAREAVNASLDYGFHFLKFKEIVAITQDANRSSCRLLDKIGMIHINNFERFNASQRRYRLTDIEWQLRAFSHGTSRP